MRAPVRICDLGGWTDTWFAGSGRVLNIAVEPGVEVEVSSRPGGRGAEPIVRLHTGGVENLLSPVPPFLGPDALVAAAIASAQPQAGTVLDVTIDSAVPPGSALGTSAAATVALLAALDVLARRRRGPDQLAVAAHRVETELLGWQSGVQDQLAAGHGGINFIEIDPYPHAVVTPLRIPDATWAELGARLVVVYLGAPHRSSDVHRMVIERLQREGSRSAELVALGDAASTGRAALVDGDLSGFGRAMIANTDAQVALHPDLVCADASAVISIAAESGASGWKVNGAGGDGGSLTLLAGSAAGRGRLVEALTAGAPAARVIEVGLSRRGVRTVAARGRAESPPP